MDLSLMPAVKREVPYLFIYGPEKVGKTTLACEFPRPALIPAEQGIVDQEVMAFFQNLSPPVAPSFESVLDAIDAATNHADVGTIIIDSLTSVEQLVHAQVCKAHDWAHIGAPGYGKGYEATDPAWMAFHHACQVARSAGKAVVLLGHAHIQTYTDPGVERYDRFVPALHKRPGDTIVKEVDATLFLDWRRGVDTASSKNFVKVAGTSHRVLYTEQRPAFLAGNRYGMTAEIPYQKGHGFAALAPFFKRKKADAPKEGEAT